MIGQWRYGETDGVRRGSEDTGGWLPILLSTAARATDRAEGAARGRPPRARGGGRKAFVRPREGGTARRSRRRNARPHSHQFISPLVSRPRSHTTSCARTAASRYGELPSTFHAVASAALTPGAPWSHCTSTSSVSL